MNEKCVSLTHYSATTVDDEGYTAIRANLPPIGFNKARVSIEITGVPGKLDILDLEVAAVVVIDPGHGGGDSGNSYTGNGVSLVEKDLTLAYAKEFKFALGRNVSQMGRCHRIVLGNQADSNGNKFDNAKRPEQAKFQGADLSLALHFNGGSTTAHGSIVCLNQQSQNINYAQDLALARRMLHAGQSVIGIGNRDPGGTILNRVDGANDGFVFGRDSNLGNIAGSGRETTYIRAVILEVEFLNTTVAAMNTLNGNNAATIRQNYASAAAQAASNDILVQP